MGRLSENWPSEFVAGSRISVSGRNSGDPRTTDRAIRAAGLRDAAGLESAVATPQATFGGEFLHSSIPAMAAAYLFHLCRNHAFIDGNKRVGANAAITFLLMNNWDTALSQEELVDVVLSIASGRLNKRGLIGIFESHCKALEER